MRRGRKVRSSVLDAQLPEDALAFGARVTMIGKSTALIEGQRGVVELSCDRIRLRTKQGTLSVLGQALCLKKLSLDAALITGDEVLTVTYGKADGA